jgi:hypothetical protein
MTANDLQYRGNVLNSLKAVTHKSEQQFAHDSYEDRVSDVVS